MKSIFGMLMGLSVLAFAGCSGSQGAMETGQPRCIDICGAEFSQCTNANPGDFTACADRRRTCDAQCRGDQAERETMTSEEEVVPPSEIFDNSEEE